MTLDRGRLPQLFAELDAARDHPEVSVDFAPMRFSLPTGMLALGSKLREWVQYRKERNFSSSALGINNARQAHSYLMHMGFFHFIGLEAGNEVGEARGSRSYVPITRISRPEVDVGQRGVEEWYAAIEAEARKVAGVLAGFDDSQPLRAYSYSIREVIRNVFEHSQAAECYICGQRWNNGQVEIAILDEGIGIARTLSEAHGIASHAQALQLAIRPGISRTSNYSAQQNVYDNSGFGLYVMSELGANFGWFVLGSGDALLYGYQRQREVSAASFRGTFFGMRFLNTPADTRSVLNDIIAAGEEDARQAGIRMRASGRSRIVL
ncbi:ATP-binding protein [Cupriavidus neocaledonicus]|uniref:ATP-binding protein n=1 Tax=Cupriavidus neocaledonicus TaxID=1040979 RepID=UPI001954CEDD|nr:ATP-binding protein [Cupriavidus neocaledonicus]